MFQCVSRRRQLALGMMRLQQSSTATDEMSQHSALGRSACPFVAPSQFPRINEDDKIPQQRRRRRQQQQQQQQRFFQLAPFAPPPDRPLSIEQCDDVLVVRVLYICPRRRCRQPPPTCTSGWLQRYTGWPPKPTTEL